MWGRNEINSEEKMVSYEESSPDRTIANIKDVLTAWRYHTDSSISAILTSQRNRVGDRLAAIEKVLDGLSFDKGRPAQTYEPYKPIDLQSEWNAWSSGRVAYAKKKADNYMTKWLENLKQGYASDYQKEAAEVAASKGDLGPKTLLAKIAALEAAIEAKPTWNLPF
jgi:chitinase